MNENKTLSTELIEFCEAHKIDTKYAGFLMGLYSKHNALIQNENKSAEEKDLAYWKTNAEEDYMKVPISVLRYISELESELTTLQQANALLKAEMESWKTDEAMSS